ncbi:MAG: hypothetical protein LBU40_06775 [Methanobrevibacter sp.]|jgi:hypothetical protein|nr:hypothetical protein [Methanobrevibacter sp.]
MLADKNMLMAYDGEDITILAFFTVKTIDDRKKLTQELIDEDRETFKKYIEVLQYYHDHEITEFTPEELIRINIDKFLNEDIVEFT